ncbi:hypothetical protein GCM10027088_51470 [Nocardia goodfellowii]
MHLVNPDHSPVPGTTVIVMVDAPTARRWLERNTNNRPVRESRVKQYHDDIVCGRWHFNGETIKFSADGDLLDGQHRLHALARTTDLRLPLLVVRGLAADTQITMDQGARRTAGDQLTLTGVTGHNTTLVAAALRVYMTWMEGNLFGAQVRGGGISTTRIVEFASAYPELVAISEQFTSIAARLKARPAVACAVAIRLTEIDPEAASEFVHSWDCGAGLAAGSPILALRERLDLHRSARTRVSDRDQIGLIVHAWNLWRRGKHVSKLQRPKGGWTPDNFPEPR